MAYAVIRTGGKQYRVQAGQTMRVEKIEGDPGSEIELDDVLMVVGDGDSPEIKLESLNDARVKAKIVRQGRDRKIRVFKFKRRKGYHKTIGHRQPFTEIRITALP